MPPWLAVIVQIPAARTDTVFPEIVQNKGVEEPKLTDRPDEAAALTVNGAAPHVRSGRDAKVIVCVPAQIRSTPLPRTTNRHMINHRERTVIILRRKHEAEFIEAALRESISISLRQTGQIRRE